MNTFIQIDTTRQQELARAAQRHAAAAALMARQPNLRETIGKWMIENGQRLMATANQPTYTRQQRV